MRGKLHISDLKEILERALTSLEVFSEIFSTSYDTPETLQERYSLIHELKYELLPITLYAFSKVPRHIFVPEDLRGFAYLNKPLPIGFKQTISQPLMIGIMVDELIKGLEENLNIFSEFIPIPANILEIGTGSGYQTAILCEVFERVSSVEIIPELLNRARKVLRSLGYENLSLKLGDGRKGFQENAPFHGIIISAALKEIPEELVRQLTDRGVIVTPLEDKFGWQYLGVIYKTGERLEVMRKGGVSFVKFLSPEEVEKIRRGKREVL